MAEITTTVTLSDVPVGSHTVIDLDGRPVAIVHTPEGVYAFDDTCTHAKESLTADGARMEDHQIECPRHGGRFDVRTGAVTALPPTKALRVYKVSVVEGNIVLSI